MRKLFAVNEGHSWGYSLQAYGLTQKKEHLKYHGTNSVDTRAVKLLINRKPQNEDWDGVGGSQMEERQDNMVV